MILPDPIHNPGAPGFNQCTLTSVQPFMQDTMPNSRVLTTTSGEHYWEINLSYGDLTREEYQILNAQIDRTIQKGESLKVWLPQYELHGFKLNSFNLTQQSNAQSSTITLARQGMRVLPQKGYLIQLSNHEKVYRITDYAFDGLNLKIDIYPKLVKTSPVGTTAKFSGIYFNTEFQDRSQPISSNVPFNSDGFYSEGVEIQLREAL